MCGISGLISLDSNFDQNDWIEKMTDIIAHRGPNDFGYFKDKHIAFGHRRLSILDLSEAGHQPMTYFNRTITYNGEIFNYIEIREELIALGYSFSTNTDTEVILVAYEAWGENCLNKFNGMWAFAIFDPAKQTVFCSRDRFGIKPFCYTSTSTFFAFGSEVKQLLTIPTIERNYNKEVVFDYISKNQLNTSNLTFFEYIYELRGGHSLLFDIKKKDFVIKKWYQLPEIKNKLNYKEAVQNFREIFIQSITLRMRSDVTVGSCLSGGLDSSSIVCAIKEARITEKLTTVSTCFKEKAYDEQEYIDVVSAKTNFEPVKIFPNLDNLVSKNLWDKMIYHQDQPILSFSHFSEFKVFEAAAQNKLIVMLDGQGSDEYLAGYPEFQALHLTLLLKKFKFISYLNFQIKRAKLLNKNIITYVFNRIKTDIKRNVKSSNTTKKTYFTADFLKLDKKVKDIELNNLSDLSKEEIFRTSIPFQLHSEDRNSMLHSIESRLPFMDYRLIEFCLSLPDDFKLRNAATKSILRDAMAGILPDEIINRHDKKGFPASDETWFKKNPTIVLQLLKDAILSNPAIFTNELITDYNLYLENKIPYNNIWLKAISFQKWKITFNVQD